MYLEGCCICRVEMKQKYEKRAFESEKDVLYFVGQGYNRAMAEALSARGVTEENYGKFFGDELCFHSPFDMANMREAAETISYLMETGGSVLIYGDYDADGLTASSILSLFFTDNGIENNVIIPTRDEGYGLHADKAIRAFKRNYYDLVITVDCGISNAEEVAKIVEELGVEVIVTDHHELPQVLPDCLCVNPKLGYEYPYLSGAGVAWKLVEALTGRENAAKYAALAAIGTIGDIMPMQDENRSIVKLGLANFNHKNLQKLAELSRCSATPTCNDVAMKIVPKINAAGRVGYPDVALDLLLCRDKTDTALCEKLLALNDERRKIFDGIVAESDAMCDAATVYKERMVFLYSEKWNHGLLGIVASRYKEKYQLPAIVMTRDGDNYVGSARGIESIDLFELFTACKDCLVKYGGHKASVGFTVAGDRIDEFRKALANALSLLDKGCFDRRYYYDVDLSEIKTEEIMALSDKLEPILPQDKIICRVKDVVKFANSFGKDNSHLSATLSCGLEVKGFFKYGKYAPFIKNGANVDLICTLETDSYTKKVCGIIEDLTLLNSVKLDDFYKMNLLKNFSTEEYNISDEEQIAAAVNTDSTVVVFDDYETFIEYQKRYDFSLYFVDIFFDSGTCGNTVAVSPLADYDFARYEHIVCFGVPNKRRKLPSRTVYADVTPANAKLYELELTREICLSAFSALKRKGKFDSVKGVFDKYLLSKMSYPQYLTALRVFQELNLIKIVDDYTVEFPPTEKQDLFNSSIYRSFNQ